MVYNVFAAYVISKLSSIVSFENYQAAVREYHPTNGRLQTFDLGERKVMTNLAKNPTGFNQNIRIVLNERGRVLALFVNDNDADGHDVSWFWDIDFERWSQIEGLRAFVGGTRANDMQVRLKYAGIQAEIVENVADVLAATAPTMARCTSLRTTPRCRPFAASSKALKPPRRGRSKPWSIL